MLALFQIIRTAHVAVASIGLLVLSIPLIVRKGGRVHRRVGWVFVLAMLGAAFTGMALAGFYVFAPLTVRPLGSEVSAGAIREHIESLRRFGVFLFFIGLLLLNSLNTGIGALARKAVEGRTRRRLDLVLPAIVLSIGAALLIDGVLERAALFMFFGVIGLVTGSGDLKFAIRPLESKMAWWYRHMNGMIVAVIAALSAFLVFNTNRLLGGVLPASLAFIPWIAPTIVGIPALSLWTRAYRKRFSDVERRQSTAGGRAEHVLEAS